MKPWVRVVFFVVALALISWVNLALGDALIACSTSEPALSGSTMPPTYTLVTGSCVNPNQVSAPSAWAQDHPTTVVASGLTSCQYVVKYVSGCHSYSWTTTGRTPYAPLEVLMPRQPKPPVLQ